MMNHSNGTFVAVRFVEEAIGALMAFGTANGIPNMLSADDYHSTIVYSRRPLKNVDGQRNIFPHWAAKPIGFDVFETRGINGAPSTKCLVLKISSPDMLGRHEFFRRWEGASHDFPSYIPHITLSYDIGDYDITKLSDIATVLPEISISQEYSEELKDVDRRKEDRKEEGQR